MYSGVQLYIHYTWFFLYVKYYYLVFCPQNRCFNMVISMEAICFKAFVYRETIDYQWFICDKFKKQGK